MLDLSVNLLGKKLQNPLILASGIMGVSVSSLKYVIQNGAGAVIFKSIGPEERTGHKNPTVFSFEGGIQNAVGLSNPGIDNSTEKLKEAVSTLSVPVIGSMFAENVNNFKIVAEKMARTGVAAIEVNLSCPNTEDDFGRMFALEPKVTREVIRAVKSVVGKTPIIAKLSAESPDIVEVAKSAEEAGADAITAINTISGMFIDIKHKRPILTNKYGGISGPVIKPMGVKAVYNIYKAVKIPIIGTGGVNTGEDALEYIMAGAAAVGVGSGVYFRGIDVFKKISDEIIVFMENEGYKSLNEIRGVVHKN
jgi:dihydroorotate dehydrogenase (NAD+) catalytic subunit